MLRPGNRMAQSTMIGDMPPEHGELPYLCNSEPTMRSNSESQAEGNAPRCNGTVEHRSAHREQSENNKRIPFVAGLSYRSTEPFVAGLSYKPHLAVEAGRSYYDKNYIEFEFEGSVRAIPIYTQCPKNPVVAPQINGSNGEATNKDDVKPSKSEVNAENKRRHKEASNKKKHSKPPSEGKHRKPKPGPVEPVNLGDINPKFEALS